MIRAGFLFILLATFSAAQQPAPKEAPAPGSPADLVQQGEKLSRDGRQDDALALFSKALDKDSNLYQAHLGAGMALDLKGDYAAAREHFTKAVETAPSDSKAQALRSLAISYAFQGDAFKASEPELQVFNTRVTKGDSVGAAETCNELARMYLELGDVERWCKSDLPLRAINCCNASRVKSSSLSERPVNPDHGAGAV